MCGIIGYTGNKDVEGILLEALTLLEYRGYDSAGIAVFDEESEATQIFKCAGRVKDLKTKCADIKITSTCGIGHTRWATHGGVINENAHPHKFGKVTVVHNGIIENYRSLMEEFHLQEKLQSETDSEVAAALLDYFYAKNQDVSEAITQTVRKLKGTFALIMLFEDISNTIYCIRNVSPIVATLCDEGAMLASDVTALCQFTNRFFVIPELCIATLTANALELRTLDGEAIEPSYETMDWEKNSADKNGYPFYMEKEIMEQPDAIRKTIEPHVKDGVPDFSDEQIPDYIFTKCERICVVACGTAMHAGLVFQALVKEKIQMHIDVEMASEFMYSHPVIDDKTLVITVSQSGETIDTLEALKYAKKRGAQSLSIINVKGSSIARESDYVLYTNAGPEIAVASTKAYTTQLAMFTLLVYKMAYSKGICDKAAVQKKVAALLEMPNQLEYVLEQKGNIHKIARLILETKDLFMIGRGLDHAILLEGSLKLKEVSYIHSEAYASGELKHGPIALITEQTPVVAVVTQKRLMEKEFSNIREVKSRGANVILFVKEELLPHAENEFQMITLPDLADELMVFPASVALQLLAYYTSADKGYDVDKPRNLAKVVTVE